MNNYKKILVTFISVLALVFSCLSFKEQKTIIKANENITQIDYSYLNDNYIPNTNKTIHQYSEIIASESNLVTTDNQQSFSLNDTGKSDPIVNIVPEQYFFKIVVF